MLNSGSVPADEEATRAQQVRSLRCAVRAVVRRSRSVLLVASLAGTAASYGVALLNGRADQHKQFEVMLNQVRSDVLQQSLIVLQARQLGRLAPGLAAQRRLLDAKCDQAVARLPGMARGGHRLWSVATRASRSAGRLTHQALHDPLTALANRSLLHPRRRP